jgi:hypothetical protein
MRLQQSNQLGQIKYTLMDLGNSMEQRLKATKQVPMQGPAYWLIHVKQLSLRRSQSEIQASSPEEKDSTRFTSSNNYQHALRRKRQLD